MSSDSADSADSAERRAKPAQARNGINVQVIRQLFMPATESTPKLAV
jgi:hypothetical protein